MDVSSSDLSNSYNELKSRHDVEGVRFTTAWHNSIFRGPIIDRTEFHAVQEARDATRPGGRLLVTHVDPDNNLGVGVEGGIQINNRGVSTIRTPEEQKAYDKEQFLLLSTSSRAELEAQAKDMIGQDVKLSYAVHGAEYKGEILAKTDIHAMQQVGKNSVKLHNLRKGDSLEVNKTYQISYPEQQGGLLTKEVKEIEPYQSQSPGQRSQERSSAPSR